jgi:hypothetical protein
MSKTEKRIVYGSIAFIFIIILISSTFLNMRISNVDAKYEGKYDSVNCQNKNIMKLQIEGLNLLKDFIKNDSINGRKGH